GLADPLLDIKHDVVVIKAEVVGNLHLISGEYSLHRRIRHEKAEFMRLHEDYCATKDASQHRFARPQRSMKVDLPNDVVANLTLLLDSVEASRSYIDAIVGLIDLEGMDNPYKIVQPVLGTCHQAVAQQIVKPIDIQLR